MEHIAQDSVEASTIPLWIDGQATNLDSKTTFAVHSLREGRTVFLAQSADADTAVSAVCAARRAFKSWKNTNATLRRDLLLRVADNIIALEDRVVESQMLETSCTEAWARMNTQYSIDMLREIASRITSISGMIPPMNNPEHMALVFRQPLGVMLTIAPWNAAVILAIRALAGQIAAGCAVVFKASELCPRTHHYLRQAFEDAGLPKGVLNVIQTRREEAAAVTEALIAHPAVRKIEFIGSRAVGNIIGQVAAKYTKPILMELGGKSPAIVLDDAKLEQAAHLCLLGLSLHHGQICFSTERIFVQDSIAHEFLSILKSRASLYDAGLPVTYIGSKAANQKVQDAVAGGAKLVTGSTDADPERPSLKPTILMDVQQDMTIFDEETFGPSASLYVFKTDQEAIEKVNQSVYGLNAAIHTTNMERAIRMAKELEVGQVHVNNMTEYDEPTLPIGGTKASGWGRSNANWSLDEYLTLKTITINMAEMHTYI